MSITDDETNTLATYNSEKARGLVHTEEWVEKMKEFQLRFDESIRAYHLRMGNIVVEAL